MNYKKLIAALLAIALVFCLGACQNKTDSTDKETGKDSAQDTKPAEPTEPTEPTEPKQEEKPPVYADMTPAEALKTAQGKLKQAGSFAINAEVDSWSLVDDNENTFKGNFAIKLQEKDQDVYDMLAECPEDDITLYYTDSTLYYKEGDSSGAQAMGSPLKLGNFLEELDLCEVPFCEKTFENFEKCNPKRTDNADGSVTYSLEKLGYADTLLVFMNEELDDEVAESYIKYETDLSFTINAEGILSGWMLWLKCTVTIQSTDTHTRSEDYKYTATIDHIGENLNLQKPDWAVAE